MTRSELLDLAERHRVAALTGLVGTAQDTLGQFFTPAAAAAVVKRFSAKEERRRIVASVWSPVEYPGPVAFENHLNVFHIRGAGLDESLARGLVLWLNSSVVDRFFRTFSGHTQVNATDLRTLRFPSADSLRQLGDREVPTEQAEIDALVSAVAA
jgi:adenine-specific DNA-methyltransferase